MRTEERLRAALTEIADAASPAAGAWTRFEDRRRRSTVVRVAASVFAAGLAATLALTVPALLDADGNPPVVTSQPPAPGGTTTHRDRILGYQLAYPAGWVREGWVGDYVAFAPSENAMTGEGTAYAQAIFSVHLLPGNDFDTAASTLRAEMAEIERRGASVTERSRTIDGRRALEFTIVYATTSDPHDCETSGCRERRVLIEWGDTRSILATTLAADAEVWNSYGEDAENIVDSIKAYEPPAGMHVPSHGIFSVDIPDDGLTDEMLRFMDARVEGAGAERWLSDEARAQYDSKSTGAYGEGLQLYQGTGRAWRYTIVSREALDGGGVLVEVRIHDGIQPEGPVAGAPVPRTVGERLVVEPASGGGTTAAFVVTSVTRAPECEPPPGAGCA